MPNATLIRSFGGPEALQGEALDVGQPAADEVPIRQPAVGLNFIDVYERAGLYPIPLPAIRGRLICSERRTATTEPFEPGRRSSLDGRIGKLIRWPKPSRLLATWRLAVLRGLRC